MPTKVVVSRRFLGIRSLLLTALSQVRVLPEELLLLVSCSFRATIVEGMARLAPCPFFKPFPVVEEFLR